MSILKHKIKTKLGENELLLAQNKEEKYVYMYMYRKKVMRKESLVSWS